MKWILVYVALTYHGHPVVEEIGRYDSMTDCFFAREELALKLGGVDGKFPVNTQALCIQHKPE